MGDNGAGGVVRSKEWIVNFLGGGLSLRIENGGMFYEVFWSQGLSSQSKE